MFRGDTLVAPFFLSLTFVRFEAMSLLSVIIIPIVAPILVILVTALDFNLYFSFGLVRLRLRNNARIF
jgi:hypothetical protein